MTQRFSDANKVCFTANGRMLGGGGVDGGIALRLCLHKPLMEKG